MLVCELFDLGFDTSDRKQGLAAACSRPLLLSVVIAFIPRCVICKTVVIRLALSCIRVKEAFLGPLECVTCFDRRLGGVCEMPSHIYRHALGLFCTVFWVSCLGFLHLRQIGRGIDCPTSACSWYMPSAEDWKKIRRSGKQCHLLFNMHR